MLSTSLPVLQAVLVLMEAITCERAWPSLLSAFDLLEEVAIALEIEVGRIGGGVVVLIDKCSTALFATAIK